MKVTVISIVINSIGKVIKGFLQRLRGLRKKRKDEAPPNDSI